MKPPFKFINSNAINISKMIPSFVLQFFKSIKDEWPPTPQQVFFMKAYVLFGFAICFFLIEFAGGLREQLIEYALGRKDWDLKMFVFNRDLKNNRRGSNGSNVIYQPRTQINNQYQRAGSGQYGSGVGSGSGSGVGTRAAQSSSLSQSSNWKIVVNMGMGWRYQDYQDYKNSFSAPKRQKQTQSQMHNTQSQAHRQKQMKLKMAQYEKYEQKYRDYRYRQAIKEKIAMSGLDKGKTMANVYQKYQRYRQWQEPYDTDSSDSSDSDYSDEGDSYYYTNTNYKWHTKNKKVAKNTNRNKVIVQRNHEQQQHKSQRQQRQISYTYKQLQDQAIILEKYRRVSREMKKRKKMEKESMQIFNFSPGLDDSDDEDDYRSVTGEHKFDLLLELGNAYQDSKYEFLP